MTGNILHQTATELRGSSRHGQIRFDDEAGATLCGNEAVRDRRRRATVTATLATLDAKCRDVLVLVDVLEARDPLVLHGDGPEAHLESAAVDTLGAVRLDGRAGQCAHHPRNVEEKRPRLLEGRGDDHLVPELHLIPPCSRAPSRGAPL